MVKLIADVGYILLRCIERKYPEKSKPLAYYKNKLVAFDEEYNEIVTIPYDEVQLCTFSNISVMFDLKRVQISKYGDEYDEHILINKQLEINPNIDVIAGLNIPLITYLANMKVLNLANTTRRDYLETRMYISTTLTYKGNPYEVVVMYCPKLSIWSGEIIKVKAKTEGEVMPVMLYQDALENTKLTLPLYLLGIKEIL